MIRDSIGILGGTFDPIHNAYRKLGAKVGDAFHDGAALK